MGGFYPYNHKMGQTIQTDCEGVEVDRSFLAHISIPNVAIADADGIMPLTSLGEDVQAITAGLTNPSVPRNVQIVGNVSVITGNVKVTGTNYADEVIDETLVANGTTAVLGTKAFKTITEIDLPVQVHIAVKQVETATAAGTITTPGNAAVTVTAALLGEAEVIAVPVTLGDDASAIALAIRTALAANANIATHFDVSGETDAVILTAKLATANDATLNIAIADDTCVGIVADPSSDDTTAGVPADQISVGWGKIFGLPYLLYSEELVILQLFDKAVDTGTVVTSATNIESNTFAPNGTPDGEKDIDLYIII